MAPRHVCLLHPALTYSGATERTLATAAALRDQGLAVTIAGAPGSRAEAARAAGIELRELELPLDPGRAPFAFLRTRRALRDARVDLLHATDERLAALAGALTRTLRIPYLVELHGPVTERVPANERWLRGAIVPSEPMRAAAINHGGLPRERVRVVPHAPAPFGARAQSPIERRMLVIGCSGFLDASHATDWFLDAARLLVLEKAPCRFVVLGEGPRETQLRRRVRKGGMQEHVTIAVPTTRAAGETLGDLDVYVSCRVPGPGWLDALALAEGVPTILAAVGEAFQLVDDGTSGVLVEPRDAKRLAAAIDGLVRGPDARERAAAMGAAARAFMAARFPPQRFGLAVAQMHALALGTAVAG